jgi:hypothetical protein
MRRLRTRTGRAACAAALASACAAASAPAEPPFEATALRVAGRPLEAWSADLAGNCPGSAANLLVISVDGQPPRESRRLTLFPCASGAGGGVEPLGALEIGPEVAALDVADAGGAAGAEILLFDARGIRILAPLAGGAERRIDVPGGLPLPPRTRALARMRAVADWEGTGRPAALLPALGGAQLVPLDGGRIRLLSMPIVSDYAVYDPAPSGERALLRAELEWPALARADDDGDGRLDLFALSRYAVHVFRGGPGGLAIQPSRRLELAPFTPREELRHQTTDASLFATDLDGDGRAELVVHRTSGTLAASRAVTQIHRNPGDGAAFDAPPAAELALEGGIASADVLDLDGDGRDELLRVFVPFGFLVTRRVQVAVDVFAPRPASLASGAPLEPAWRTELDLRIDFDEGRVIGFVPSAAGDFNGDGRRDLIFVPGMGRLGLRLGLGPAEGGPGFGPLAAEQPFPLSGSALAMDLDGDRLDEIVAFDPRSASGEILVLRNRGVLPGTPASVSPRPRAARAAGSGARRERSRGARRRAASRSARAACGPGSPGG